jgi:hypothetical protein
LEQFALLGVERRESPHLPLDQSMVPSHGPVDCELDIVPSMPLARLVINIDIVPAFKRHSKSQEHIVCFEEPLILVSAELSPPLSAFDRVQPKP